MHNKLFNAKFSKCVEYSQTLFEKENHKLPIRAQISDFVVTDKKWCIAEAALEEMIQFKIFSAEAARNGHIHNHKCP